MNSPAAPPVRPARTVAPLLLVCAALLVSGALPRSALALDDRAKKLSRSLKPGNFSPKGSAGDIAAPKQQIISIIEQLQISDRGNGPSAQSLIEKAYSFRDDVGPVEKVVTANAYLRNWKEAQALGLFDERNRFHSIIKRGPEAGKTVSVEYIIPPSIMPEMSRHPANVRIVTPARKRAQKLTDVSQLSAREKAYLDQFAQMIEGARSKKGLMKLQTGGKFTSTGICPEDEQKRWQAAMKEAGEAAEAAPEITLRARKGGSPAHRNGHRWKIDVEVVNSSRHPTEIQLQYWLVGSTDNKRLHYVMKKGSVPVKLISGATRDISLFTDSEASYKAKSGALDGLPEKQWKNAKITFRGFLLRAVHETGPVAVFAPDQRLLDYLDEESDRDPADLR